MTNKRNIFLISIFLVFSGVFFRFYQLNFENYWLDEMVSFWIADPNIPLDVTFSRFEYIDYNSPLFNLILKKHFTMFGYRPDIGRYLPFFFGILAIPFLGILSYQVKKDNSFLLTILLASINIYLIKYSQETRPYSLVFLLSIINLIFYYKIISLDPRILTRVYIFILFIIFSVLSLTSHPFVFIIFFSQITFSIYSFFIFKNKNLLFYLSIPFILIIYLFINYNYLIDKITYEEYFLQHENWKFYYNYYFSRFFGSKLMGLIYLSTLIFLIIHFKKKILLTPNNYLPLLIILFFSYIIPLFYGLIRVPILTDRYIIFVLIPILILISSLIFEIDNKKLRTFLLIFILIPTIINHYIEINLRLNTKPEFSKLFNHLNKQEIKNLTLNMPNNIISNLVENYIISTKEFKNNDFKMFNINNISSNVKMLWVICYEPLMGFNCIISDDIKNSWILLYNRKTYLVDAKLFEITN